ncbi:hypothetical protein [Pseudonocardia nigra]|uniref:hypothetical protein n=1 Tax=Pseudonocardia nigra TaxID=1921578 RepID=UPI001C5D12F8|nr:hypothetical protein [Pseudonocardia nigra]
MTEPQQPDPEAPRPPGTPELDLDVPVETGDRRVVPDNEDVDPDTVAPEPPD